MSTKWLSRLLGKINANTDLRFGKDEDVDGEKAWGVWQYLLEGYARRDITRPTDRLNAIAGIAQVLSASLSDRYLAGLWHRMLPRALLWSVPLGSDLMARPSQYCGPSWSWASVQGAIAIPNRKDQLIGIPLSHPLKTSPRSKVVGWDIQPLRLG